MRRLEKRARGALSARSRRPASACPSVGRGDSSPGCPAPRAGTATWRRIDGEDVRRGGALRRGRHRPVRDRRDARGPRAGAAASWRCCATASSRRPRPAARPCSWRRGSWPRAGPPGAIATSCGRAFAEAYVGPTGSRPPRADQPAASPSGTSSTEHSAPLTTRSLTLPSALSPRRPRRPATISEVPCPSRPRRSPSSRCRRAAPPRAPRPSPSRSRRRCSSSTSPRSRGCRPRRG